MSETYLVGGFVRDLILGLKPKDRDFVVVGSSPEEMLARGFKKVGADFPVFLDPDTQEEHALARTDRKSGVGYNGFSTEIKNVTLEDDLQRRDLTINAIAMTIGGDLVDPCGGVKDIESKVFRHVSDAFMEDPLRVLRLARFMARYGPEWRVDTETKRMVVGMVSRGEVDTVTQERIWVEFEKGLLEDHPELMLSFLSEIGLLSRKAFSTYSSGESPLSDALARAVAGNESIKVRCALAFPEIGIRSNISDDRVPTEIREVSTWFHRALENGFLKYEALDSRERVNLLLKSDAIRQSGRFDSVLRAMDCFEGGSSIIIRADLKKLSSIDRASIIGSEKNGLRIKEKIYEGMVAALDCSIPKKANRPTM